jgi:hypothetical protein
MLRKKFLFKDKMIGRKNSDNGLRIPLVNVDQRKKNPRSGVPVFGLNDNAFSLPRSKLASNLIKLKMFLCDNDKESLRWNRLFGSLKGVLQHGSLPDEIDVLLRQVIAPQPEDEVLHSPAGAAG